MSRSANPSMYDGPGRSTSRVDESLDTDVVGARAVAQVVDLFAAPVFAVVLATLVLRVDLEFTTLAVVIVALSYFLYNVLFEALFGGKTVGKLVAGIEVRSVGGDPASLGQIVVRNFPAVVVPTLVFYLVALLSIAMDDHNRRLFDHVAHTVVVRARSPSGPSPDRIPERERRF